MADTLLIYYTFKGRVVSSLNLMNPLKNRETVVRKLAAFAEKLQ